MDTNNLESQESLEAEKSRLEDDIEACMEILDQLQYEYTDMDEAMGIDSAIKAEVLTEIKARQKNCDALTAEYKRVVMRLDQYS